MSLILNEVLPGFEAFNNAALAMQKTAQNGAANLTESLDVKTVVTAVEAWMNKEGYTTRTGVVAQEALVTSVLQNTPKFDQLGSGNLEHAAVEDLLNNCGVPANFPNRTAMAAAVYRTLAMNANSFSTHFERERSLGDAQNNTMANLSSVVGQEAYTSLANEMTIAQEAFGSEIQHIHSDSRMNVVVTIVSMYKNIIDRALTRNAHNDPFVLFAINEGEVYDLERSADPNPAIRYGGHRIGIVDLYRNPTPVSTQSIRITPLAANDVTSPKKLVDPVDGAYIKIGTSVNLFQLARDANRPGYKTTTFSDLVGEDARIDSVLFEVTYTPTTGSAVVERFKVDLRAFHLARFVASTSNSSSADRVVNLLNYANAWMPNSVTEAGAPTAIFSLLAGHKVIFKPTLSASLNLMTSQFSATGHVELQLVNSTNASIAPTAAAQTEFDRISVVMIGIDPNAKYDMENMRKATTMIRSTTRAKSLPIPPARTIMTEFSLQQQEPSDVVQLIGTVNALGNAERHLKVIQSTLQQTFERNASERLNPDLPRESRIAYDAIAGTKVLPYVEKVAISMAITNTPAGITFMRSSELPSEGYGHFQRLMMGGVASLHANSLYTNVLDPGEEVQYAVFTHRTLIDTVVGTPLYHSILNDAKEGQATKGDESDYTFRLPNGVRLLFIGTNIDDQLNRMDVIPVRRSKPSDVTSFGAIWDRGIYTGTYSPTQDQAVTRRIYTNAREVVLPTNPMGMIVNFSDLAQMWPSLANVVDSTP